MKNQPGRTGVIDSLNLAALSRRRFLGGALAVAASSLGPWSVSRGGGSAERGAVAASLAPGSGLAGEAAAPAPSPAFERKIKLGVVGNGGRGAWIAQLFKKHGGYEMHAVADYFADVAAQCGDALGVDKARRFSTLSGYQRLFESGVEAVALEVPPYFFPEQASAAVEAGLHVYMAKPVAADVPGSLRILEAGKEAARRRQCFFVDYQMPTDPVNQEVLKRLRGGSFGGISQVATVGISNGFSDPPRTATLESRLRSLIWVSDVAMGGDNIGNYDIHAIDAALWVLGRRPVAATGASRICRPNPHGDARDVCSVVFEYDDGLVHNHFGQALPNLTQGELSCHLFSDKANAMVNYWGKAHLRAPDEAFSGSVDNLYEAGAMRNIATFYNLVIGGQCENQTVPRAVDGILTCILGREAAARRTRLTMDEVLKENKRLEVDLRGLKT
jgi:predicted dehydrogenase